MPAASIEVKGAKEAIEGLKRIDRSLASELKRGMKEDAKPILADARSNAQSIAYSGAYASSMAMRAMRRDTVKMIFNGDGQATNDMFGIKTAKTDN